MCVCFFYSFNLRFFFFIRSRFCFTFHSEPIIINHVIWIFIKQWLEKRINKHQQSHNRYSNWNIIFLNLFSIVVWSDAFRAFCILLPWFFDFKWLFNDMICFDSCYRYSRRSFLSFQLWIEEWRIDMNETRNAIISKRFNNETVNAVVRAFLMNVFCFMQFCTQPTILQTGWRINVCVLRAPFGGINGIKWKQNERFKTKNRRNRTKYSG